MRAGEIGGSRAALHRCPAAFSPAMDHGSIPCPCRRTAGRCPCGRHIPATCSGALRACFQAHHSDGNADPRSPSARWTIILPNVHRPQGNCGRSHFRFRWGVWQVTLGEETKNRIIMPTAELTVRLPAEEVEFLKEY